MQRRTRILSILASALVALPSIASVPGQAQVRRVAELSAETLASKRGALGLDDQHSFTLKNHIGDELNQVHSRFQQSYNGVKVWGGEAIMHIDATGRELPMTNTLMRNINLNTMPSMDAREALAIAHAHLAPKGPYTEDPTVELVVYPHSVNVLAAHARSKNEADINATDMERQVVRYQLAYHVHTLLLNGAEETRSQDYLINAHTGEILETWNTLHTSAVNGTGVSQWYGTVPLNTNSVTSGFEMRDMTRGTGGTFGNNVTTNLNHATSGSGTIYTDADNAWGDGNGYGSGTTTSTSGPTGQTAAVDQHHGMAATWDFYKNVLGRNGIDNTGKAAYGAMHYSSNYDNAFWQDSCFCMTYGDGAPPSGSYGEADLDTVGHEMSHGVCATTANLTYSGESGGLNESNSDIFGTCVEFYVLGAGGTGSVVPDNPGTGAVTANYMMFENSWGHAGQALRYMYKPSLDGASPDAWSSTTGGLDVHYSSGPMNRCFYFMARGATTTGDTSTTYLPSGMTGIGNDKAARIWYRTLTTKLTASSNYAAARTGAIASAQELYGAGSAAEAAVWNAFHGINVGAAWTGTATAPAITTQPANVTVSAPATATFSVVASGTAPLTYQWFKGTTSISGATAASYTTPATSSADNGTTFHVTVTNSAGSATSNNAILTVSTTPVAPAITSQPANKTVAVGSTASFTVTASGTAPMTYQWYKGTTAISGATSASYTTPATVAADNGSTFHVTVTNSVGSATSNNATLTVTTTPGGTFAEVEANNSIATANAVAGTYTTIQGNLTVATDVDYYALTLAAGQKVTINMTGPTGVDWDLYLKNSAGTTLTSSLGSTATESVTYTNTGASAITVYPEVIAYSGVSSTPYNLALSYVTPPPSVTYNEVESNNTIATANAVPATATKIVGYIGSSTDNDYFAVAVGAGRTLAVGMTGPTGSTYDYDLYFYNAAGTSLASGTGSTTTENVSWTNGATATTVYVAVKRYAGSSTTTPYNLTVSR